MRRLRAWIVVGAAVAATSIQACTPRDGGHQIGTAALTGSDGGGAGFDADFDAPDGSDALLDAFVSPTDGPGSDALDAFVPPTDGPGSDALLDAFVPPTDGPGSDALLDAFVPPPDAMADAMTDGGISVDAMTDAGAPDAGGMVAVDVVPTVIDFGEIRVGAPAPSVAITVTNLPSSTSSAQVTGFALQQNKPGLVLTTPALPFSLAPGASAQGTLRLDTLADTDLTGEIVDLTIDGGARQVSVLGKVVTPSSRVEPVELDLGTACVGTAVSGIVMLINDGTATLAVDPPQIDASFIASSSGAPTTSFSPMASLTATVSPATTAAGPLSGTLMWHDDVPTDHSVPVTLEYVVSGIALSPRGLDFGSVAVEAPDSSQLVKLQNCDLVPSTIEIESLTTKQGPLRAWHIVPPVGTKRQLSSQQEQEVTITFDPPGRGRYEAELTIKTPAGKQFVQLLGDSTGRDFDNTSFYTCTCTGGAPPAHGWPIALAIVLVGVRRRRRQV